MRPGLTGWAQVNGRNDVGWEERFALDVWYIENRSLWLDLRIVARTVVALARRRGISAEGQATMTELRPPASTVTGPAPAAKSPAAAPAPAAVARAAASPAGAAPGEPSRIWLSPPDVRLPEHQQTFASKKVRGVNLQEAVTHFAKLAGGNEATLLELSIETGRTHQIRRHLAAVGHPVVGDSRYGDFVFNRRARASMGLRRMFLHSSRLALQHPITGKRLAFSAPLPDELTDALGRAGIAWQVPSTV